MSLNPKPEPVFIIELSPNLDNIPLETLTACCPYCASETYAEKNNYTGELVVTDNGVKYLYKVIKEDNQYYASNRGKMK